MKTSFYTSVVVAALLAITPLAAQADRSSSSLTSDRLVVIEPVEYTDQQVIAATVGCAVLFGALAAMTSGISTAVGAVAGGSICAIGFGEDYFQGDRIVGYESGA